MMRALVIAIALLAAAPASASRSGRVPPRPVCDRGDVMTFCGCQPRGKPLTWADCV